MPGYKSVAERSPMTDEKVTSGNPRAPRLGAKTGTGDVVGDRESYEPLTLATRFLRLFADVRAGETPTVLLLTASVFFLLTAYYLLKIAREPLILLGGGAEVKSYASVGQSLLLIVVTTVYGWVASRVARMPLITWVTLFFVANLVVFWVLGERGFPLGVPFFLWVGIFSLMTIAQFWSFAADIYGEEQGKRLFPIIGIGSSVGAVAGAWVADEVFVVGPFALMLLAAGILLVSLGLVFLVHRRERDRRRAREPAVAQPIVGRNGFALVVRDRYLLLFAVLIFMMNWVTKTGDYVLDRKLLAAAHEGGHVTHAQALLFIGQFKARFFQSSNVIGVVLQMFAVSRIIKYLGLRVALLFLPLVSLVGYGTSLAVPLLSVLFVARAVEGGVDYSLSNTTRQALWLGTSRNAKYKAKQVIDTFVVRAGDTASAGLVWVGAHEHLGLPAFIAINVALCVVWLASAILLGRTYAGRTSHGAVSTLGAPLEQEQPSGA
jgi:ATP:ADP antiporter, AAA family